MTQRRTLWEEGSEPAQQIIALGAAVTLTAACADLLFSGGLHAFFDLCFVGLCVGLALMIRPGDFFTSGVLPPLLLIGVLSVFGLFKQDAITNADSGLVGAVTTGLGEHVEALLIGSILTLVVLAIRRQVLVARPDAESTPRFRSGQDRPLHV